MKPLLNYKTRNKIKIVDKVEELLEFIDAD